MSMFMTTGRPASRVAPWPVPSVGVDESSATAGFPPQERRWLLCRPGISHGVVSQIERCGVSSLLELRTLGVDMLIERLCRETGSVNWKNRRRALVRALEDWQAISSR